MHKITQFYLDYELPGQDLTPVSDQFVMQATANPNPFNPSTTINFILPNSEQVSLKIYNIRGERVKILIDERLERGSWSAVWWGKDDFGGSVASGVYFYELRQGSEVVVEKMMLIK